MAQWITRLPTEQKIPGSSPGRVAIFFYFRKFIIPESAKLDILSRDTFTMIEVPHEPNDLFYNDRIIFSCQTFKMKLLLLFLQSAFSVRSEREEIISGCGNDELKHRCAKSCAFDNVGFAKSLSPKVINKGLFSFILITLK